MLMKLVYTYSLPVLADLNYSEKEASRIIRRLEDGNFAYTPKMSYPKIADNEQWLADSASGIDVPVLWTPDSGMTDRTVLLLAQDPLRDEDYWDPLYCSDACRESAHNRYVIVGTPYALHLQADTMKARLANGKKKRWNVSIYRRLIEAIVRKDYNVYCTDIFKYYFRGHSLDINEFDKTILNAEIIRLKEIGLSHIVCLGNPAQRSISEFEADNSITLIKALHPRARNWYKCGERKWTDVEKISYIIGEIK